MDNSILTLQEILKDALPRLQEPILFRNMLRDSNGSYEWKLLKWSFSELVEIFGDKKLPFRIGDHNKRTCIIQHHNWCINNTNPTKSILLTLRGFVEKIQRLKKKNKWCYCDYKHMEEWFKDKPEIIESFNWLKFGIDKELGKNGLHSTIWIGSKGAHTDCHRDTYGYNLVAQTHGRKQWLLYPPNDSLIPVRLPYEESTIYSRFNIYCLSEEEQDYLLSIPHKPKLIILEPGDVLFVPNGWWHYVESLDFISMSVNMWSKLKTDSRARVEESLVKLIVAKLGDYGQFESKETTYYTTQVENAVLEYIQEEEQENKSPEESLERPLTRFQSAYTQEQEQENKNPEELLEEPLERPLKRFKSAYTQEQEQGNKNSEEPPEEPLERFLKRVKSTCTQEQKNKSPDESLERSQRIESTVRTAEDLAEQYPNFVKLLHDAKEDEFAEFLRERRNRNEEIYLSEQVSTSEDDIPNPQYESFLESVINALCHPDVISKAAKILLERHY